MVPLTGNYKLISRGLGSKLTINKQMLVINFVCMVVWDVTSCVIWYIGTNIISHKNTLLILIAVRSSDLILYISVSRQ